MSSRRGKELKLNAADGLGTEGSSLESPNRAARRPKRSAPAESTAPAAPQAPVLKTGNFVEPAWRGIKYITPEVFRRRAYAYFGHHPAKSTMHRWLNSGRIRAIRVGNRWLIPESTWEEFLEYCKNGERI